MRNRALLLRCGLVLIVGAVGLGLLNWMAPVQWPTVAAYAGLLMAACGLAGVVWPPKWLGVRRRRDAAFAVLGGVLLVAGALLWPARTSTTAGTTFLDAALPVYEFEEHHELAIHAPPDRVVKAMREVTFADIGVMRTLGRVRSAAMGDFRTAAAPPPASAAPILALITGGRTGFFPLGGNDREFVFGLAGQPWNTRARPVRLKPEEFRDWKSPGNIKVAANFRVEDAGNGWSRLSTDTRVAATDDAARRTMARYWRLIYPGSGLIRKSLLEAVSVRATSTF